MPDVQKTEVEEYDFSKLFTVIPALLIMLGVTRLGFYYSHFKINILPFLDFSEILTSFLDFTLVIIATISSFLFIPLVMSPRNFSKSSKAMSIFRPIFFLMPVGLLFFVLFNSFTSIGVLFVCVAGAAIVFLWTLTFGFENEYSDVNRKNVFLFVGISFSLLVACMYFISTRQEYSVKKNQKYLGVKVTYNDSTQFISDSNVYYIGNTNNYLFFYDQMQAKATVRKMDDVKEIVFP